VASAGWGQPGSILRLTALGDSRHIAAMDALGAKARIGRMGGAGDIPVTVDQLRDYVEAMRPHLAINEQTVEFINFLGGVGLPGGDVNRFEQLTRRLALHGAMYLMPDWARRLTGLQHPELAQRWYFDPSTRFNVRLLRWAFDPPPYRALADARLAGTTAPAYEGLTPSPQVAVTN
jgi:uncharacterized protein (DUF2236 family)